MRIAGGILSILGGIYALVFGISLATGGLATGIVVLLLGAVGIAGGICALRRWIYILALIGAICVVVARTPFCRYELSWRSSQPLETFSVRLKGARGIADCLVLSSRFAGLWSGTEQGLERAHVLLVVT